MGANADFDGDLNDMYLRQQPGSRSILLAKRGGKTWRIQGIRAERRWEFVQATAPSMIPGLGPQPLPAPAIVSEERTSQQRQIDSNLEG